MVLVPLADRMVRVDLRTIALTIPPQEAITRDNVPVRVNAVAYFKVVDPVRAVNEVENHAVATSQQCAHALTHSHDGPSPGRCPSWISLQPALEFAHTSASTRSAGYASRWAALIASQPARGTRISSLTTSCLHWKNSSTVTMSPMSSDGIAQSSARRSRGDSCSSKTRRPLSWV
ncbi:SPFH domain-containing protein [Microbispora bryophytorum]|uniref:SPFH domain-containing protein n=1 Tax=Microbispora bryophytorum TaxID=1460882 RepID=UPI00295E9EAE|nr:SPFH domain-containing protein [Microbispora camponoti]